VEGDDFHHNGAFRLSYGFEYAFAMEQGTEWKDFPFDRADTYAWYLELGPLSRVDSIFGGRIPSWRDFAAHPDYDDFWLRQAGVPNIRSHVRTVTVPTLKCRWLVGPGRFLRSAGDLCGARGARQRQPELHRRGSLEHAAERPRAAPGRDRLRRFRPVSIFGATSSGRSSRAT